MITDNAYGQGPVERLLTPLRGLVRPGNSGGPMLDSSGRVLTTVFAATVDSSSHGGYGVANASLGAVLSKARARAAAGADGEHGRVHQRLSRAGGGAPRYADRHVQDPPGG